MRKTVRNEIIHVQCTTNDAMASFYKLSAVTQYFLSR